MKRKFSFILLSLLTAIFCTFFLIACDEEEHVHVVGKSAPVSATCTSTGLTEGTYCVTCGEILTAQQVTAKLAHTFGEWVEEVPATCVSAGVKGYKPCTECENTFDAEGNKLNSLTIAPSAHTFGEWVDEIPATCTTAGVKGYKTCSVCENNFDANGERLTSLEISANGHSFSLWVNEVSATCTTAGIKGHKTCSVCDKDFNENEQEIESLTLLALGHSFGTLKTEVLSTCTSEGAKEHKTCANCNKNFDAQGVEIESITIEKTAHSFGSLVAEIPATCLSEGVKAYKTCSLCEKNYSESGALLNSLVINRLPHAFGEWQTEISATCTTAGVKGHKTCSICDKDYNASGVEIANLTITKLEHNFGAWVNEQPATCLSAGVKGHKTCANCQKDFDNLGVEIPDLTIVKLNHSFGAWNAEVRATCLAEGVKAHKVCATCYKNYDASNVEISSLTIEKASHEFGSWHTEVPSTCLTTGTKGYKACETCSKNYDENGVEILDLTIDMHNFTVEEAKYETFADSANTTSGALYYKTCRDCGILSEQTFESGEAVADTTLYEAKNILLSLYDTENLTYGLNYRTANEPMLAVLEIKENGASSWTKYDITSETYKNKNTKSETELTTFYKNTTEISITAGTTYVYRVRDLAAGTTSEEFTIKGVNPEATSFKFIHMSDTQDSIANTVEGVNKTVKEIPEADFTIHTGDFSSDPVAEDAWDAVFNANADYFSQTLTMPVAGNHDAQYRGDEGYQVDKHFNINLPSQSTTERGMFYSYDYCNVRFIILNTNYLATGNVLPDEQMTWLTNLLDNNPNKWTIVAMHNPVYSAGRYGSQSGSTSAIAVALQAQLTQFFVDKGVDLVLQGHDHVIQRTYAVTGYDTDTNTPIMDKEVATETIGGIEYQVNPNGTYYMMSGSPGYYGIRVPVAEANLDYYAYVNDNQYKFRNWSEIEVTENTITIVTKYLHDSGEVRLLDSWGIKKTA